MFGHPSWNSWTFEKVKMAGGKTETLEWIENNLEEYLKMTTFT